MNNPSNGPPSTGGGTLLFGGSELTVLVTFQLPLLTANLVTFGAPGFVQLFRASSFSLTSPVGFSIYLTAVSTGGNSGNVTASFTYTNSVNYISTQISPVTQLMVTIPMLLGGWVSAAFSVSSAGVATLSVRDIFTTNNATSGAFVCARFAFMLSTALTITDVSAGSPRNRPNCPKHDGVIPLASRRCDNAGPNGVGRPADHSASVADDRPECAHAIFWCVVSVYRHSAQLSDALARH
jgi:hypothetical protein